MNNRLENSSLIDTKRNFGLDVMRSCAILLVLLQHGQFFIAKSENQLFYVQLFNLIDGVSIFFVLSGFLIGRILVKEFIYKEITFQSILNFWLRRWLRTIPSYYLVLTIVLILTVIINKQDTLLVHFQYYFFLQNITFEISKFYPEAWSLSIEEWFYFTFPIVGILFSLLLKLNKKNRLLFVILLFLIVPFLFRLGLWQGNSSIDVRKIVIYRLDAIVYGVLMAFIISHTNFNSKKWRFLLLFLGLFLLGIFALNPFNWKSFFSPINFVVESISICLFIPFLMNFRELKWEIINRVVRFISTRSYALYLVNLSLIQGFILNQLKFKFQFFSQSEIAIYLLFWVLCFLFADFIYRYFEKPILNWRDSIT